MAADNIRCSTAVASSSLFSSHPQFLESSIMAEAILNEVNAASMFNLRGVVAVVTGGATVSTSQHITLRKFMICNTGNWAHDEYNSCVQRRDRIC